MSYTPPISPFIIGADIGGSHITAAQIDASMPGVINSTRFRSKVNTHGLADEILETWAGAIQAVKSAAGARPVSLGIAMPGPFDYQAGISLIRGMNKYEALYGMDIRAYLSAALQLPPESILFMNDAQAYLQGESRMGAARGCRLAAGITLGTGLGAAFSCEGQCQDAALGVHAFKEGIAEDYLSTRWFVKRYKELSGTAVADTLELASKYAHDPVARQIFHEFQLNLADFLAWFIQRDQPEVMVIGGNIARAHELFLPGVQALLLQKGITVPVKITALWEDAALLGATCALPAVQPERIVP